MMNSPLINGVYDLATFQTLSELGVNQFGFDLRGKSPNLIPFKELNNIIPKLNNAQTFLLFEDDKITTILSFLNLLKNSPVELILQMRDVQTAEYYSGLKHKFYWMFNPRGDVRAILSCENLVGVLLPYRFKEDYKKGPELWEIIDRRELEVYIHAQSVSESGSIPFGPGMKLSIDLDKEVEKGFRQVDQEHLKNLPVWSKLNENSSL